jgi:hypothetical protein
MTERSRFWWSLEVAVVDGIPLFLGKGGDTLGWVYMEILENSLDTSSLLDLIEIFNVLT